MSKERDTNERIAVPAMPLPMAIICCVLNFLVPGFGTILAGFTKMCCATDMALRHRCGSCTFSFCIGILQLLFVNFFLLGWVWSCLWGCAFITMSAEYYQSAPFVSVQPITPSIIIQQPSQGPDIHYTETLIYLGSAQQPEGYTQPLQAWDIQQPPPPYTITKQ